MYKLRINNSLASVALGGINIILCFSFFGTGTSLTILLALICMILAYQDLNKPNKSLAMLGLTIGVLTLLFRVIIGLIFGLVTLLFCLREIIIFGIIILIIAKVIKSVRT